MPYSRCGKRSRITSEASDTSSRIRLRLLRGTRRLSLTYPRCMHRVVAATVLTLVVLLGFGSCAQTDISASDIYRIGCPAVDAAAGGGSMVSKVTVLGLKKLSESGKLDPEPQRWLEGVISMLDSEDPKNAPDDVQKLIKDGCAKNGYPLQNLDAG
jgi:hypothetical protein